MTKFVKEQRHQVTYSTRVSLIAYPIRRKYVLRYEIVIP